MHQKLPLWVAFPDFCLTVLEDQSVDLEGTVINNADDGEFWRHLGAVREGEENDHIGLPCQIRFGPAETRCRRRENPA